MWFADAQFLYDVTLLDPAPSSTYTHVYVCVCVVFVYTTHLWFHTYETQWDGICLLL